MVSPGSTPVMAVGPGDTASPPPLDRGSSFTEHHVQPVATSQPPPPDGPVRRAFALSSPHDEDPAACKTVHWIRYMLRAHALVYSSALHLNALHVTREGRHAEATSNKAAHGLAKGSAERSAAYDDIRWFDARLSPDGDLIRVPCAFFPASSACVVCCGPL
jgi:hypothetical protein